MPWPWLGLVVCVVAYIVSALAVGTFAGVKAADGILRWVERRGGTVGCRYRWKGRR